MSATDPFRNRDPETVGERLRSTFKRVVEHKDAKEIQASILNEIFLNVAPALRKRVEQAAAQVDSRLTIQDPNLRFTSLVQHYTVNDPQQGGYESKIVCRLPLNDKALHFTPKDIREMKGYIELHKIARELDVAVRTIGLVRDEENQYGSSGMVAIVIDLQKSYKEGLAKDPSMAPKLPPPALLRTDKTRSCGGFKLSS